jgi:hypothetical protein
MSKSLHLSIPEPCHEGWDKMTQVEKGRFCQSCQKTVVDFSQMSDKQILEHITKASTQTCGHFYTDQLNRSLIEANEPRKSWWKRGWNMVAASFLFSTASYAQGNVTVKKPKLEAVAKDKKCESKSVIMGMVLPKAPNARVLNSTTMLPIEGVTVTMTNADGSQRTILSNKSGHVRLNTLPGDEKAQISFTAVGYKPVKLPVSYFDSGSRDVYLEENYVELDTVVVTAESLKLESYVTDGMIAIRCTEELTLFNKFVTNPLVRKITDTFSSVKVYPNPAIAGSMLNIQMDFSDKGPYKLELFNPLGQLVMLREIDIVKDQQLVNLPLEKNLVKGMYIVRINHQESKKRYTKKVVVN